MRNLKFLFDNNKEWAENVNKSNPGFFTKLAAQQNPKYLWIGCSDSRVPANEIVGMMPGEIFVHRNIANLVIHTDINCLSVIQYAVEILKVEHIIVCGHYGCGGIEAALDKSDHGLLDNWLRHIKDIYNIHRTKLEAVDDIGRKKDLLCELNVVEQVSNVCHTSIVQNAWKSGQQLSVHGWIYSISDGILRDMDVCISDPDDISAIHRMD